MNNTTDVKSPCVRNCCLNEEDVCMGCYRTIAEIIEWGQANNVERNAILQMAKQRENTLGINKPFIE